MDQKQLIRYDKLLQNMKRQITDHIHENETFGLDKNFNDSIGELSGYDNHPADIGTELFDRTKDMALRKAALAQVEQIDMALKKIQQGTYGTCERCGKMIPDERLQVRPESTYCIECSEQTTEVDTTHSRPVEEAVLYSGYLNTESWNDVEQYGTSNDISMMNGETDYNDTYMKRGDDVEHYHMEYDQIYTDQEGYTISDYYENAVDEDEDTQDEIEQYAYMNYLRQKSSE